jgi:hypothetical protein
VTGGDPRARWTRKTASTKAAIYVVLVVLGVLIHSGPQFALPLEMCWNIIITCFVVCAIVYFIDAFGSERAPRTRQAEDGREIQTSNITVIAYGALVLGIPFAIAGAVFPAALIFDNEKSISILRGLFASLFFCVLAVFCVMVFIGLRKFRNWARIMASVLAILTIPISWLALWVLFVSDAKYLFAIKAATNGTLESK